LRGPDENFFATDWHSAAEPQPNPFNHRGHKETRRRTKTFSPLIYADGTLTKTIFRVDVSSPGLKPIIEGA
jgi:hypothetical protein